MRILISTLIHTLLRELAWRGIGGPAANRWRAGMAFFVVRTLREDQTLRDHLAGYREYQARVRWRLLPGVW